MDVEVLSKLWTSSLK